MQWDKMESSGACGVECGAMKLSEWGEVECGAIQLSEWGEVWCTKLSE